MRLRIFGTNPSTCIQVSINSPNYFCCENLYCHPELVSGSLNVLIYEDLNKYVQDYVDKVKETTIEETSRWLSQEEVDKLRYKYFDSD